MLKSNFMGIAILLIALLEKKTVEARFPNLAVVDIDVQRTGSCNQRLEVCCGGIKYNGIFFYDVSCCGNQYYYPDDARCCLDNDSSNLTIVRLPSRRWNNYQLQCCGTNLYNITTQICCNNRIQTRTRNTSCCGDQTYNPREAICCQGTVTNLQGRVTLCCGSTAYDPTQYRCLPNNITREIPSNITRPQVCGNDIIDFSAQICCEGQALGRQDGITLCCGSSTYNAVTEVCCQGTVLQDRRDGSRCCGSRLYQPANDICCNGNVIRRPEGTPGSGECCSYPNSWPYADYRCCGQELLNDTNTQICCDGSTLHNFNSSQARWQNDCCGVDAYNSRTQTCCEGRIVDGYNVRCCRDVAYDDNTQTCCNNQLFQNGEVPRDMCCCDSQLCYSGGDPFLPH